LGDLKEEHVELPRWIFHPAGATGLDALVWQFKRHSKKQVATLLKKVAFKEARYLPVVLDLN